MYNQEKSFGLIHNKKMRLTRAITNNDVNAVRKFMNEEWVKKYDKALVLAFEWQYISILKILVKHGSNLYKYWRYNKKYIVKKYLNKYIFSY